MKRGAVSISLVVAAMAAAGALAVSPAGGQTKALRAPSAFAGIRDPAARSAALFAEAGKVLLELVFRNDRMETPEDGLEFGKGVNGPIIASEVVTLNLQSRLTVSDGQTAVAGQMQNNALLKRTQTHIIVAARIADETPPSETK
jgi:hypothetical protein